MIRTKILGQERFSQAHPLHLFERNSDLGHFSIGPGDANRVTIEEVFLPPQQLWIRAKVHLEPCPDILVMEKDSDFVWKGERRCAAIKLEAKQILWAQKGTENSTWSLSGKPYIYEFAVSPIIRATGHAVEA